MKEAEKNIDPLKELVDRISFRLLATRNHPDNEWMYKEIKSWIEKNKK